MNEFSGVHILECLDELVDDEFFVNFLQDSCADDDMKVYLREKVPVSM